MSGRPPYASDLRILRRDIEFDFARQLDDGFWMMAILEQRVFDRLSATDEQAAKKPFCSRATQLPRRFLPIKTTVEAAVLHEGGSTSFTFTVLSEISTCMLQPISVATIHSFSCCEFGLEDA